VFAEGLPEGIALAGAADWTELSVYERRRPQVRIPVMEAEEWAASYAPSRDACQEAAP